MRKYSAKLLFQYHVVMREPAKRRICEKRMIVFEARSPREALRIAKRRGKRGELSCKNDQGNMVLFQFVGLLDLLELGIECESDEVWYDVRERLLPMERQAQIIPSDDALLAPMDKRSRRAIEDRGDSKRKSCRPRKSTLEYGHNDDACASNVNSLHATGSSINAGQRGDGVDRRADCG